MQISSFKQMSRRLLVISTLCFAPAGGAHAQQEAFSFVREGNVANLDYRFSVLSRGSFDLSVLLPLWPIEDESSFHLALTDTRLVDEVETAVQQRLDQAAALLVTGLGPGVHVNVHASGMGYRWSWGYQDQSSLNGMAIDEFERQVGESFRAAVSDGLTAVLPRYYWTHSDNLNDGVNVTADFAGVAQTYAVFLKPLAKALQSISSASDQRGMIEFVANFVQGMPYHRLEGSGAPDFGTGFLTPPRLLRHNMGDCEAKSVLLAALLHTIYPELAIVYAAIPDHGLLGLVIESEAQDAILEYEDRQFVLLEAAGQDLTRVGQVYPDSEGHLSRRSVQAVIALFP
jgi:hypothetical protein